jgi:hypothetical protein
LPGHEELPIKRKRLGAPPLDLEEPRLVELRPIVCGIVDGEELVAR